MDGWSEKPIGWNAFDDSTDSNDDSFDVSKYPQQHIFLLAGGLDQRGHNHPWVQDRLQLALKLYQKQPRKIFILGGGTYHKPPHINKENFVIHESTMGAKYLIDRGVDPDDIYREWSSYDTIANGFFSLLNFVIPLGIKDILVITSDFHMARSRAIFKWIFGLWSQAIKKSSESIELTFLDSDSSYLDNEIIDSRINREKRSLRNLRNTIARIDTWSKFHRWFYTEHQAYNCHFNSVQEVVDEKTKATY